VSGPCTLVISLSLSLMYPNIPGLLFLTFVICRILASLLRPFYLKCLYQARKASGHVCVF
jgi:hypothetical protein